MEKIKKALFEGERSLFGKCNLDISDTEFGDGESPLKCTSNIQLNNVSFSWKYPLWYSKNITAMDCTLFDMARAGIWYSENLDFCKSVIHAPKNFRKCKNVRLEEVCFTNAEETLWNCEKIQISHVDAKGDYFGMNMKDSTIDSLHLEGNYSFDGSENVEVHSSTLLSKDSFWNSKNVEVFDSYISGEYIGWNSENLTFVNCTIESLQGFCYIKNLKLINCKLNNTTLAFEYCTGDIDVTTKIDSIINPLECNIKCPEIGELILEQDKIDITKSNIICPKICKKLDKPSY